MTNNQISNRGFLQYLCDKFILCLDSIRNYFNICNCTENKNEITLLQNQIKTQQNYLNEQDSKLKKQEDELNRLRDNLINKILQEQLRILQSQINIATGAVITNDIELNEEIIRSELNNLTNILETPPNDLTSVLEKLETDINIIKIGEIKIKDLVKRLDEHNIEQSKFN